MLYHYGKIDFTFCGVTLHLKNYFQGVKIHYFCGVTTYFELNKIKKSLVHYGDNALVFASTNN